MNQEVPTDVDEKEVQYETNQLGNNEASIQGCNSSTAPISSFRSILSYWKKFAELNGVGNDGPMSRLYEAMCNQTQIVVMTRGLKEPRASLIGNLIVFDRYWNMILANVTEISFKLPNSALRGHSKPGRSRKRREQRARKNCLSQASHSKNDPIRKPTTDDCSKENFDPNSPETHNVELSGLNNKTRSNWTPVKCEIKERDSSQLADISLWLEYKSKENKDTLDSIRTTTCFTKKNDPRVSAEQQNRLVFVRGSNIIHVQIKPLKQP